MMRLLAWCGTNQSMSSAVMPACAKVSSMTSVIMPTACLNTSRPSIRRWPTVPVVEGPPSTKSFSLCAPSERRLAAMMPRSASVPAFSSASSTSAPAPSPNSTQVPRSLQSRMREKVSAPMTRTRLARPPLM